MFQWRVETQVRYSARAQKTNTKCVAPRKNDTIQNDPSSDRSTKQSKDRFKDQSKQSNDQSDQSKDQSKQSKDQSKIFNDSAGCLKNAAAFVLCGRMFKHPT